MAIQSPTGVNVNRAPEQQRHVPLLDSLQLTCVLTGSTHAAADVFLKEQMILFPFQAGSPALWRCRDAPAVRLDTANRHDHQ